MRKPRKRPYYFRTTSGFVVKSFESDDKAIKAIDAITHVFVTPNTRMLKVQDYQYAVIWETPGTSEPPEFATKTR